MQQLLLNVSSTLFIILHSIAAKIWLFESKNCTNKNNNLIYELRRSHNLYAVALVFFRFQFFFLLFVLFFWILLPILFIALHKTERERERKKKMYWKKERKWKNAGIWKRVFQIFIDCGTLVCDRQVFLAGNLCDFVCLPKWHIY